MRPHLSTFNLVFLFARVVPNKNRQKIKLPIFEGEKKEMFQKIVENSLNSNREGCAELFDKIVYSGDSAKILETYPWKTTVDYYFRDYPAILMNIENQFAIQKRKLNIIAADKLNKIKFQLDKKKMYKILLFILWDKARLKTFMESSQKENEISLLTGYIEALGGLCLGNIEKPMQYLLQILNEREFEEAEPKQQLLKSEVDELNLKEQILFNALVYHNFLKSEGAKNYTTKPIDLLNKLKNKQKLITLDFKLTDYEQFLNVWFSYKSNDFVQWTDLESSKLTKFYRYLFLLAENATIEGNQKRAVDILSYLPAQYPLRQYLEMIHLLNMKKHEELEQKIKQFMTTQTHFSKMPEFDFLKLSIINLPKRMTSSKEQLEEIDEEIQVSKQKMNIIIKKEAPLGAIPHYYLLIPFQDFFISKDLTLIYLPKKK